MRPSSESSRLAFSAGSRLNPAPAAADLRRDARAGTVRPNAPLSFVSEGRRPPTEGEIIAKALASSLMPARLLTLSRMVSPNSGMRDAYLTRFISWSFAIDHQAQALATTVLGQGQSSQSLMVGRCGALKEVRVSFALWIRSGRAVAFPPKMSATSHQTIQPTVMTTPKTANDSGRRKATIIRRSPAGHPNSRAPS